MLLGFPTASDHFQVRPNKAGIRTQFDVTTATITEHPIKVLARKAEIDFAELLARQSSTFDMATAEYLHRYKRHPPPGFEIWYDFAMQHDSVIIDEFDIINETLAPFWSLSGAEVKRRLNRARGPSISQCQPSDRQHQDGCEALGGEVLHLLQEAGVLAHLPEMDVLINEMDEPRMLRGGDDGSVELDDSEGLLDWKDLSHRRVWDDITACCQHDDTFGATQRISATRDLRTYGFASCIDNSEAVDLCSHPEYRYMHGFWRSPTSFSTTLSKVPVLSPAVLSIMDDIPFPAAAYLNPAYTYDESEDMPWGKKIAGLYWAGKTTGSFQESANQAWKQDHRQRFVGFANDLEPRTHAYLWRPSGSNTWQKRSSSVLVPPLYTVHSTDVVQYADHKTNDAIRGYFQIHDEEPREEAFKYTLAFDLDGNGHSGRFYRLLKSRSLPLKQTVFREWHDERLQPWLHYVPISLGMEDLPEAVRYLTDDEDGRQIAAVMAERGRQWSLRVLRPVDQAVYIYRLMLELARLQDPGRPAS
jgi:hypothetical protein